MNKLLEHKTIKLKTGFVTLWKSPILEARGVAVPDKKEVKKDSKKNWTVITYKDMDKNEIDETFHFDNPQEIIDKLKISKTSFYKYVKLGKDVSKSYFIKKN
tara:strand:- start:104 stop:409 length:306 start_codon:yes stop_codon:yes gene_type:complete